MNKMAGVLLISFLSISKVWALVTVTASPLRTPQSLPPKVQTIAQTQETIVHKKTSVPPKTPAILSNTQINQDAPTLPNQVQISLEKKKSKPVNSPSLDPRKTKRLKKTFPKRLYTKVRHLLKIKSQNLKQA